MAAVGEALNETGGYGPQRGHTEVYRGANVPKLKLEIAVEDERLEDVVEAIQKAARSCKIGEGKIFVLDLEAARRIRHQTNRPASGTGAGFPALSSCGKAKIVGVP